MPKTWVYSGGPYLNAHFTAPQQAAWGDRPLWIAGYPNYWPPLGWNKGANHTLHQFTDKYQLPGMTHLCDMSRDNPAHPLEPSMPTLTPGAGHGFHGEQTNQIIPLIKRGLQLGIHYKLLNSVHNPGRCRDAFDLDPAITTMSRFKFPHTEQGERWENGQDVEFWSEAEHLACARAQIQLCFTNTNAWERAGIKFYTPGINEWNLDGDLANWTAVGHHLHLMMDEAENRSAEFGQTIRLAVPGISQGKPQYWQMQQMIATGCFDRMAARGDLFTVHEGRFRWETGDPIPGLGITIPQAPACPTYGGSGTGRINYWYDLGVRCDFAVTECYDGLSSAADPAARLARMKQTDDLYRHNPHYRGTAWFEFVDNADSDWRDTDFTPTVKSTVFEAEMIRESHVANPTGDDEMSPLFHAKALIDLTVRDAAGQITTDPVATSPDGHVVGRGTTLHVYAANVTAGAFANRVTINPNGNNIWGIPTAIQRI